MDASPFRVSQAMHVSGTRPRLMRSGRDGLGVYAVTTGQSAELEYWVMDANGRVLDQARSELIAVAKMQALALQRLRNDLVGRDG